MKKKEPPRIERFYGFPLFDHIAEKDRFTVADKLDRLQVKKHGTQTEVGIAIGIYLKKKAWPVTPPADEPVINAPLAAEEAEIETLKEMSQPPRQQERVE
jgi:hypothetical protein